MQRNVCFGTLFLFLLTDLTLEAQDYPSLQAASDAFARQFVPFPTQNNLIRQYALTEERKKEVVEMAKGAQPMVHEAVAELMREFIAYKQNEGSEAEKKLYSMMTLETFVDRLLKKRPLMFMTENDMYLLRSGVRGEGGFDSIGSDKQQPPLLLEDYLSYDEMAIAAMVDVSVPTYFINDGARDNRAKKGIEGSFQPQGIYVGLVGSRFEKPGLMEWAHMVITPEQNRAENGYGSQAKKKALLEIWARFYQIPYFPSYEEAKRDTTGRYFIVGEGIFINREVYKRRMRMTVEPFLVDANERAKEKGKQAFVFAAGTGMGVWLLHPIQQEWLFEVYLEVLNSRDLPQLADIQFAWSFENKTLDSAREKNKNIVFHFSKRHPVAKLEQDKLLVASYSWDGNAFPGNEYWIGELAASGDPAAACCSGIAELQNPYVNLHVSGQNLRISH